MRENKTKLRKVIGVILVLFLGVFGSILTELPNAFPNSNLVSLPPRLGALDAGFADLLQFDAMDVNDKPIGLLKRGDRGFNEVYDLLRICNPDIPHLKGATSNPSAPKISAIVSAKEIKWSNPQGEIPVFRPILLYYEGRGSALVPICGMRDLAFLIRDRKVSFWSRFGSVLALVALFLQTIPALSGIAQFVQQISSSTLCQAEREVPDEEQANVEVSTTKNTNKNVWMLPLAHLCAVLGVILLWYFGKGGNRDSESGSS